MAPLHFVNLNIRLHAYRRRLYVCDLAGAEPAAEVHCAQYSRQVDKDGHVHYEYSGRHPNKSKTDELVRQGKKINLSLSEMTGFFRQMARLIKQKKFNPGRPIPGCRTYFLGKFLKNTLMHAQTYLFAAIRPELQYQAFTESTLDFANNASVIKLKPRRMDSHQVTGNSNHEDPDAHDVIGLLASENQPAMLHEKLNLLHDVVAGRRPLTAEDEGRLCDVIDTSSAFLPEATCITLKKLITGGDPSPGIHSFTQPRPCSAALMNVIRKALTFDMTDGRVDPSQKAHTSNSPSPSMLLSSSLESAVAKASKSLLQEAITLEDRATAIQQIEAKLKAHTDQEKKSHEDRIRRGSTLQMHRSGSVLFGMDHRHTSIAHAIMLCSGKEALHQVMKRKDMPPSEDDDVLFEETALSQNPMIQLVISLLADLASARKEALNNVEAENLITEVETLRTQIQTQEAENRDLNSLAEQKTQKQEERIQELELLVKTRQDDIDKLSSTEKANKQALLVKNKSIDDLNHSLVENRRQLEHAAELEKKLEQQLNESQIEIVFLKKKIEEITELGAKQSNDREMEITKLKLLLEKNRTANNKRLENAEREREKIRAEASQEADMLHVEVEKAQKKIAALAGRTWLNAAKAGKAFRGKDEELKEAHRAFEAVNEEMETLAKMHDHALHLEREKSKGLNMQLDEAKREWSITVHALETAEVALAEAESNSRVKLANVDQQVKSIQYKLEETVAEHRRQASLEQMKQTALVCDRERAEASLIKVKKELEKCQNELKSVKNIAAEVEHRGNMTVSNAETRALAAEQAKESVERHLSSSEAELEKSKRKLKMAEAEIESLKNSAGSVQEIQNLEESIATNELKIDNLEKEIEESRQHLKERTSQLQESKLELQQLTQHADSVEELLENTKSELSAAKLKYTEDVSMLKKQIAKADALRSESLQQSRETLEHAEKERSTLIDRLQTDLQKERENMRAFRASSNEARLNELDARHAIEQEMQTVKMHLSEKEREASAIVRERDHAIQDIENLQASLKKEQMRADSLEEQISLAARKFREFERQHKDQYATWTEEKSQLRRELDAATRSISSYKTDLDREQNLRSQDRQREDDLNEQIRKLQDELRSSVDSLSSLNREKKNYETLLENAKRELTSAGAREQTSSEEYRLKLEKGSKAIKLLQEKESEIATLKASYKESQKELKKAQNSTSSKKAAALRRQLKEARAAAEDAQAHAATALEVANAHKDTISYHKDGHEEAKSNSLKHKQSAAAAKKAMVLLKKKLALSQERVRTLETEHATLIKEHAEHVERVQAKASSSRNKLLSFQKEVASTRAALAGDERWQTSEDLKKQVADLREERSILKAELSERHTQADEVAASHSKLCAQYKSEITDLRERLARELDHVRKCEHENDAKVLKLKEDSAIMNKSLSKATMELHVIEGERDKLRRELQDTRTSWQRDVEKMLQLSKRKLFSFSEKSEEVFIDEQVKSDTMIQKEDQVSGEPPSNHTHSLKESVAEMIEKHSSLLSQFGAKAEQNAKKSIDMEKRSATLVVELDQEVKRANESLESLARLKRRLAESEELLEDAKKKKGQEKARFDAEVAKFANNVEKLEESNKLLTVKAEKAIAVSEKKSREAQRIASDLSLLRKAEETMSADVKSKESELRHLKISLDNSLKEVKSLQSEAIRMQKSTEDMHNQREQVRDELKLCRQNLSDARVELERMKGQLSNSETREAEIAKRLELAEVKLKELLKWREDHEDSVLREREEWERAKVAWTHQVKSLKQKQATLKEDVTRHAAASQEATNKYLEVRASTKAAEDQNLELEARALLLERKVESLEKKNSTVIEEIQKEREQNKLLQKDCENLKKSSRKDLHLARVLEESLRHEKSEVDEELAQALDRATTSEVKCTDLMRRLADEQKRSAEIDEKNLLTLAKLKDELAVSEKSAKALEASEKDARSALEQARMQMSKMRESKERLVESETLLNDENIRAKTEIDRLKRDAQHAAELSEQEVSTFEKQLAIARAEVEEANKKLSDVNSYSNNRSSVLQSEMKKVASELTRVQESSRVQVRQLEAALSAAKDQYTEAKAELGQKANIILELTLETERSAREKTIEVRSREEAEGEVSRLQAVLKKQVDETEGMASMFRVDQRETKVKIHRLEVEVETAQQQAEKLSKKHNAAISALAISESSHSETKNRLEKFRESYQVAQTYLNEANSQIENVKSQLASEKLKRSQLEEEYVEADRAMRKSLLKSERQVEELEEKVRRDALSIQSKEDLKQQIQDLKDEMKDRDEQRILVERALALFGRNEKSCLREVRHCQELLDKIKHKVVKSRRRRRSRARSRKHLRNERQIIESVLAGTEEHLSRTIHIPYVNSALTTPQSVPSPHHDDHHHHDPDGKRHCSVCESIKNEEGKASKKSKKSRRIPPFQEKGTGLGGGATGKISVPAPVLSTPRSKRRKAWAVRSNSSSVGTCNSVDSTRSAGGTGSLYGSVRGLGGLSPSAQSMAQSQHTTVELSAAIRLLEQTLLCWSEEQEPKQKDSPGRIRK